MTDNTLLEKSTSARWLATHESGSQEWHDLRATGIGGSEVGTICGLNRWESAFTLWAKKTGRIESSIEPNEAMEWGTRLEPVILDKLTDAHPELVIHRNVGTWAHPERDWQLANPDAIFQDGDEFGIVEVKTAQYEDDWRNYETGEPAVPPHYEAQVLWYLQTLGYRRAIVVALFHGNRYREFEVKADDFAMEANLARVTKFREYVLGDIKPDFDGALSTYTTVRALHPAIEDDEVELGWLGVEYFNADESFKAAEAELIKVKSLILDAMGTAKRGLVEGEWRFTRQARGAGDPYLVVKRG